jgi:hypothetical protein
MWRVRRSDASLERQGAAYMHKNIKAIETEYAGCRFRSRLEARWAVFFDALKIPWEYEPEGIETSAGPYLPDFRIRIPQIKQWPGMYQWFEVKPKGAPEDPRHAACAIDTGRPLIVARDLPRDYSGQMLGWNSALIAHGVECGPRPVAFTDCTWPSRENYCTLGDQRHWCQEDAGWLDGPHLALYTSPYAKDSCGGDYPPLFARDVDRAYTAARSARFEFGETGR